MSYQVLARKYRPHSFQEMVGQEHVLRALINALDQQRLHHAYLFTGTRGVGKTTLARILAKCLNCETGISSNPCNQCATCLDVDAGRFIDLIEIDAASRTKVEDTRELLDNVQYAPARGRYKVYLIDETHMLSGHSFNALLKTLEEPPTHVKFLLATTDPQRLPITVLSRCLQFNLKKLAPEQIKKQLEFILGQEKIPFEINALSFLARAADGSVRDSLSLLDQAIAYGNGQVNEHDVRVMLGSIEQTHILHLVDQLARNDANALFATITQLSDQAADFGVVLEELLSLLHRIAVLQIIPDPANEENAELLAFEAIKKLTPEAVQLYYQIGLIGRRDLPLAPSPRSGFEMVMLRMLAFQLNQNTEPKQNFEEKTSRAMPTQTNIQQTAVAKPTQTKPTQTAIDWNDLIPQLNLTGFTQELAMNCALKELTDERVLLWLDPNQTALRNPKQEARLAQALSSHFDRPLAVQISPGAPDLATPARAKNALQSAQLQAATTALQNDAKAQSLLKAFDAIIQPGSIQVKQQKEPELN